MHESKKERQAEAEASFRAALEEVPHIIKGLAPYCATWDEMLEVVGAAQSSDSVLRLVMEKAVEAAKRS